MKAKHFKKIKKTCMFYDVEVTNGLFGSFPWDWDQSIKIFARNPENAFIRAQKRGYGLSCRAAYETSEKWGTFRAKPSGTSDHFSNITYFC